MYDKETIDLWIRRAEGKAGTNTAPDVCAEIAQAMLAYNSLYGNEMFFSTIEEMEPKSFTPTKNFRDCKYIVIVLAVSNLILLLYTILSNII